MPVRRVDGRWRYQKMVRLPDGGKERISGTPTLNTKLEAERAERKHIERVLNPIAEQKEVMTFGDFVTKWLEKYPASVGNRPSTIREKESHVRVHLRPALGAVRLDDVQGEVMDSFFAKLRTSVDGVTPAEKTIKNIRATLRKVLVKAVEWGDLDKLPGLPKVKVPDSSWDFLTKAETTLLIGKLSGDPERQAVGRQGHGASGRHFRQGHGAT